MFTSPPLASMQVNFNETATNICSMAITFTVANQGAYISEPISIAFSGTDADDFVVLPMGDTCTRKRLPVGATCEAVLNRCPNNFNLHYATATVSAKAAMPSSINLYGYSY